MGQMATGQGTGTSPARASARKAPIERAIPMRARRETGRWQTPTRRRLKPTSHAEATPSKTA